MGIKAEQAAAGIITKEQLQQLQAAGLQIVWSTEIDFLLWAANCQEHKLTTYKKLDQLQRERENG